MKLIKNMLLIVTLFTIGSVSAKNIGAKPAGKPTPAPASTTKSFKYYLDEVKKMQPTQVINDQGVFTDTFESYVKQSGLDMESMKALLEAGRDLKLPLSGDNDLDITTVQYAGKRIDGFTQRLSPISLQPIEKDITLTESKLEVPDFYDINTNLANQSYLRKQLNTLLKMHSEEQVIQLIVDTLLPSLEDQWKKRKIQNTQELKTQFTGQVVTTLTALEEQQKYIKEKNIKYEEHQKQLRSKLMEKLGLTKK